jgi:hypothetical protein
MAATTTTLSALLQEVYIDGIRTWFNQNRPIWNRIAKVTDKRKFVGEKLVFAASEGNTQGVGARGEDETLPTAGNSSLQNMELAIKHHYAVVKLTAQIMALAGRDEGSFAEAVDLEVKGARDEITHDLAWNTVYGAGYGELCRLKSSGGVSGTTFVAEVPSAVTGAMGTRYIRKNMLLDAFDALTGGNAHGADMTVSSVTGSSATFVVDSAGTTANSDYIFRADTRGKVVMGLGGVVDDGGRVNVFQTLDRDDVPLLQANILDNGGTLRAWTPELMDTLCSEAWNNGNGTWPTVLMSPLEIQQRAAAYIRADRKADMKEMTLDNGYKTVSWTTPDGQKPWLVDQFCRSHEVIALNEDDLFFAVLEDFTWEDRDGSRWRTVERKHAFEAWLYTSRNLGAYACNSHSALRDISHSL